jgi:hypothetical protein
MLRIFFLLHKKGKLATNERYARANGLGRKSLGLIGNTNECTLFITNNCLSNLARLGVPDFSSNEHLHIVFLSVVQSHGEHLRFVCYGCILHEVGVLVKAFPPPLLNCYQLAR